DCPRTARWGSRPTTRAPTPGSAGSGTGPGGSGIHGRSSGQRIHGDRVQAVARRSPSTGATGRHAKAEGILTTGILTTVPGPAPAAWSAARALHLRPAPAA